MFKKKQKRKSLMLCMIVLLVFTTFSLFSSCSFFCRFCKVSDQGLALFDDAGKQINAINVFDNLRVRIINLEPGRRYTLRVVNLAGRELSFARMTAGHDGVIPTTTLLFGENLFQCHGSYQALLAGLRSDQKPSVLSEPVLTEREILQDVAARVHSIIGNRLFVEVLDRERIVRRAPISIKSDKKPILYVADRYGCLRGGLIQGRDDVYVIGRNFPAGSRVRLFAVEDQRIWRFGDRIKDITGLDGMPEIESVQLSADQSDFFARIWPKERLTRGLYDVIGRYSNKERLELDDSDVLSADNDVGLTVQADASDPHIEQNMTVPATDSVLYYLFQDKYFNDEDVWVAVNPKERPAGISGPQQNARIYVVNHLSESQWVHGTVLNDVSPDSYEEVPIKGSCRNQNEVRVWEAGTTGLTNGNYDVVVDFSPFGVYDQGQDIIDELDNAGFQVVNPTSLSIVYPVNPLRVFPEKEVPTGQKKDYIYAVVKISPGTSGSSIYWDSIDIDDPNSDAAPVDPNGATGDDNRGNYGANSGAPDGDDGFLQGENASGIATTTTNNNGIAYVLFYLTSQPGDNFTIRASTSANLATYDESATITAWRKLHIEVDSMGAPTGTTVTGNITNVVNIGGGQSRVTVDVILDDGDPGSTGGRFENGILTAGGTNYPVVSNTSTDVIVQGSPTNGLSFDLVDDDVVMADVPAPDISDLERALAPAFVLPVFDTGQDDNNVNFDLNTEMGEFLGQVNQGKDIQLSTADYWNVTVQAGFQTSVDRDNDPDDEGTWRGGALGSVEGVIVFEESIRDWIQAPVAAGGGGGVDPAAVCALAPGTPRRPRRQEIVVHEVGHLLSLDHPDGNTVAGVDPCGGVMLPTTDPRLSSNFTQQSLHKIRSIQDPG